METINNKPETVSDALYSKPRGVSLAKIKARNAYFTHYRVLEMAECVMRRVETDIFIAKHSKINNAFAIMSEICDNYSGWLDDDTLTWSFIDGSIVGWDRELQEPYIGGEGIGERDREVEAYC